MFDRNEFDLRIAQHHERVGQIDQHAWRSAALRHPLRSRLARLLVTLAARIAPWLTIPDVAAIPTLEQGAKSPA